MTWRRIFYLQLKRPMKWFPSHLNTPYIYNIHWEIGFATKLTTTLRGYQLYICIYVPSRILCMCVCVCVCMDKRQQQRQQWLILKNIYELRGWLHCYIWSTICPLTAHALTTHTHTHTCRMLKVNTLAGRLLWCPHTNIHTYIHTYMYIRILDLWFFMDPPTKFDYILPLQSWPSSLYDRIWDRSVV